MINNNIRISIISLTKNEDKKLLRTLKSIKKQRINFCIEWIIIDGSNFEIQNRNEFIINQNFNKNEIKNIFIRHINSYNLKILGIYQCMNYGKKIALGEFLIYLNSGDEFFDNSSLI